MPKITPLSRCFVIPSSFVIRHSSFRAARAFTIIELLVVMTIILVLAGLILATSGYVQNKGKRSRAEAEIAAISAALENYKADNGIYPSDTANGTTTLWTLGQCSIRPRPNTRPPAFSCTRN